MDWIETSEVIDILIDLKCIEVGDEVLVTVYDSGVAKDNNVTRVVRKVIAKGIGETNWRGTKYPCACVIPYLRDDEALSRGADPRFLARHHIVGWRRP